jgi:hypothetical protein
MPSAAFKDLCLDAVDGDRVGATLSPHGGGSAV